MTSPWSSPRMAIRSVSRFSPGTGADYSTAIAHTCAPAPSTSAQRRTLRSAYAIRSIHTDCGLCDQDLGFRALFFRRFFVRFLALVFRRIGEHRNPARFVVQLQHRQHLEAVQIFDADAQDDEIRLHALDLGVGVRARLHEHDIVVPRLEY